MSAPTRIIAGPFNRVEGDLEIRLDIDDGRVVAARVNSPLFRGFERMLRGKDPRDALTITPRICGICSVSQSAAAARALAEAQGLAPTPEGAIAAAIIHGVENLADHLTHFNLFFMPDFAKPVYEGVGFHEQAHARFAAGAGSAVRAAVDARTQLLHIMGLLAGKWPHTLAIQPGGVTKAPDARDKVRIIALLRAFRAYLEADLFAGPLEAFAELADPETLRHWHRAGTAGDARLFLDAADATALGEMGRGPDRFMSFGAYRLDEGPLFRAGLLRGGILSDVPHDAIVEDISHAWMEGGAHHPFEGETSPDPAMAEPGYTWCKAPRLAGETVEVGALARQIVDGHPLARALGHGGADARARVIGRLLEIARLVIELEKLALRLDPGADFIRHGVIPDEGRGAGLVEAARGSLGHWVVVRNGRIANYQIIAPTTWNFSPRDAGGGAGPVEAALEGAPVRAGEVTPIAVQHIVRSFDPCMVCTVH